MKKGDVDGGKIRWGARVAPDDFDAARRFLRLVFRPQDAKDLTAALKTASIEKFPFSARSPERRGRQSNA
jgi:hypothetical protein